MWLIPVSICLRKTENCSTIIVACLEIVSEEVIIPIDGEAIGILKKDSKRVINIYGVYGVTPGVEEIIGWNRDGEPSNLVLWLACTSTIA
jgi:hypothetical protein